MKRVKLKSIVISKYFDGGFEDYLSENGFDYNGLSGSVKTTSKKDYYLKTLAQYPGGENTLNKYLKDNTPRSSTSAKDKGVVIVGFAVDMDGSIIDIKIHRSVSKKSDKQAIKIIKGMPNWIPAEKTDGSYYKSTVSISIPFL
jgi:TonB family protein